MMSMQASRGVPAYVTAIAAAWIVAAGVAWAAMTWKMEAPASKLTFNAKQAGANFEGRFEKFAADIRFDPKDLAGSRFDVRIDLASVNSKDKDRDDTLRSADFFDIKRWPQARYVAERFTAKGPGKYSAVGKLTLRDVTRETPIEFSFEPDAANKGAWLKGTAQIKRLEFGVGQGEWKDVEWVADDVRIDFALKLLQ